MKFKQEDAEKSLSRELKNFDEIDTKKELIKSLIKKEKAKNKKLSNRICHKKNREFFNSSRYSIQRWSSNSFRKDQRISCNSIRK